MTQDNSSAQLVGRLQDLLSNAADLIERLARPQPSTRLDMGAQQAGRGYDK